MLDYTSIKGLAQQIGRPAKDLVVLAPANDPFYAGVPARQREAEWFSEIWHRFGFSDGVHLRRIHYVLVSQREGGELVLKPDTQPYENTSNDWSLLARASLSARYLDLIPLDALVDRRNDEPIIFCETTAGSFDPGVEVYGELPGVYLPEQDLSTPPDPPGYALQRFWSSQTYVVEVWIEKSTQNDWLVPLCRRREVNLVVGLGESSEIQSRHLAERVQETGLPARIIYMSDFDPAGRSMPVAVARKLEFYIGKFDFDVDVTLNPLVLTEEQSRHYRLPRTPIKDENRRDKFEEKFGAGATELDALEALYPGEMGRLLEQELDRYLDPTLDERVQDTRWEIDHQLTKIRDEVTESHQDEIDELTSKYDDVVSAVRTLEETAEAWEESAADLWETIADELREQKPDLPEPPTARPANEPDGFVLFDSKRDYLNQIDAYREWQRR